MSLETVGKQFLPCLFLLMIAGPCHAKPALTAAPELVAEHQRGVKLAREGQHDAGLAVLTALHKQYPGYYPVERDIVIITAWKGDCRAAVRRYERIRDYPAPESYFILPVSECLIKIGRINEALTLLDQSQKDWPADTALASAYAAAQAQRAAQFLNELRLEVSTDTSDQGRREWRWGATLTHKLTDRAHVYLRQASTRSSYDDFQSGKQDRLGIGVEYEFRNSLVVTQEFSDDVHRNGQNGSFTRIVFSPNDGWRYGVSYTTFAEDLPLRAKSDSIDAKRSMLFIDYHGADYRWSWSAAGSRYDFSDTNRRDTLFTSLGYAYELQPKREQRVFVEYYESENTLANAAYFNPSRDKSVSLVHKTDFVLDTRFHRHVDHLTLSLGRYDQQGFAERGIWGVRYEQDYDFTQRTALSVGVGYGRRAYDGASETETSLNAVFRWLF